MPLYDFLCSNCGHQDEVITKLSDGSIMFCPVCKNKTFKKQLSAPHFKLKGSGWYETDFKNKNKTKKIKKEKEKSSKKNKTEKLKNDD